MILKDSDFDGYIGIECIANTEFCHVDPENGMLRVPIEVLWCPSKHARKGRYVPQWNELAFVMNADGTKFTRYLYTYPNPETLTDLDLMNRIFHDHLDNMLQEVEEHFCDIGQCKMNPVTCPARQKENA